MILILTKKYLFRATFTAGRNRIQPYEPWQGFLLPELRRLGLRAALQDCLTIYLHPQLRQRYVKTVLCFAFINGVYQFQLTTDETCFVPRNAGLLPGGNNKVVCPGEKFDIPQPHPLPMPEYGGYFAPLTEYLPDSSQPISGFHR